VWRSPSFVVRFNFPDQVSAEQLGKLSSELLIRKCTEIHFGRRLSRFQWRVDEFASGRDEGPFRSIWKKRKIEEKRDRRKEG